MVLSVVNPQKVEVASLHVKECFTQVVIHGSYAVMIVQRWSKGIGRYYSHGTISKFNDEFIRDFVLEQFGSYILILSS